MAPLLALVIAFVAPPTAPAPPRPVAAEWTCPDGTHDTRRPATPCVDPETDRIWLPRIDWPTEKERWPPQAVDVAAKGIASLLRANPAIAEVRIEGHLETHHAFRMFGRKVCRNRAVALAERVAEAGVERARLRAVGYGDDRPIHDYRTPEGRMLNRRFELHITRWQIPSPASKPISAPPAPAAPAPAPAR